MARHPEETFQDGDVEYNRMPVMGIEPDVVWGCRDGEGNVLIYLNSNGDKLEFPEKLARAVRKAIDNALNDNQTET